MNVGTAYVYPDCSPFCLYGHTDGRDYAIANRLYFASGSCYRTTSVLSYSLQGGHLSSMGSYLTPASCDLSVCDNSGSFGPSSAATQEVFKDASELPITIDLSTNIDNPNSITIDSYSLSMSNTSLVALNSSFSSLITNSNSQVTFNAI